MTDDDRDLSRLVEWLQHEAASDGPPTDFDPVLVRTSRTRQLTPWRARWEWLVSQVEHHLRRQPRSLWPALAVIAVAGILVVGSTWRPDADDGSIVFSADDGLYVAEPDGSDIRRIADAVRLYRSAWSPDGSRLLVSDDGGGLRAIGADGRAVVDLSAGADLDVRAAAWAPDGSRVVLGALDSARPDIGSHLYVIGADGTGLRPFETIGPGSDEAVPIEGDDPAWSSDGSRLAYTDRTSRLWIVRADGSEGRALSAATSDHRADSAFTWAPDSSRITFQRASSGPSAAGSVGIFFVIGVEDGDERRISVDARDQLAPSWSPDGRHIAWFIESRDGFRIVVFDVAVSEAAELPTEAAFHGGWLAWSPDGSWLATYTSDRQRLALISVDRLTPDVYVHSPARISGVLWQPRPDS